MDDQAILRLWTDSEGFLNIEAMGAEGLPLEIIEDLKKGLLEAFEKHGKPSYTIAELN